MHRAPGWSPCFVCAVFSVPRASSSGITGEMTDKYGLKEVSGLICSFCSREYSLARCTEGMQEDFQKKP